MEIDPEKLFRGIEANQPPKRTLHTQPLRITSTEYEYVDVKVPYIVSTPNGPVTKYRIERQLINIKQKEEEEPPF